jgi:hypothetical protein
MNLKHALFGLLVMCMLLAACGGGGNASQGDGQPPASASGPGQVTIIGAIEKSYTPREALALPLAGNVSLTLSEEDAVSGVALQFPADTPPGTYVIEDHAHEALINIFAEYARFDDGDALYYLSTTGTLNLTAAGDKFSGTFEFTAAYTKDDSKTIKVAGSFADVPFDQ